MQLGVFPKTVLNIFQGDNVPSRMEYSIIVEHTFSTTRKYFKCEEVLYVSDESTESHYRKTHPKNLGKSINLYDFATPLSQLTFS